jgi:hypothetical protein
VIRARLAVQATDDIAPFGVVSCRSPHEISRLSALHVAGLHDDHPRAFRTGVKPEAVGWSIVANALLIDLEEAKALYERYAVPAASDVLADIALANLHRNPPTEVDFAKQGRIPLLFIGMEEDHVVSPKATMHNERKYDDSVSITEYHEFEGRPHFRGASGWEEVADFAIDWAERHAGLTVAEHAAAKDPVSGG